MGQINLNAYSAMLKGHPSAQRVQNTAAGKFDSLFTEKLQNVKAEKNVQSNRDSSSQKDVINKPIISNKQGKENDNLIEDAVKDEKKPLTEMENLEAELLALIQTVEGILQQIDQLSGGANQLDLNALEELTGELKIQLDQLLSKVEVYHPNVQADNKLLNLDLLQETASSSLDALVDILQEKDGNIQPADLDEALGKLQETLKQQLEDIHTTLHGKTKEIKPNTLANTHNDEAVDQVESIDGEKAPVKITMEKQPDERPASDKSDEETEQKMHHGVEKKDTPLQGFKANIGVDANLQQSTSQILEINQVNQADQLKFETPAAQQIKLNNIIEQVTSKVQVHVGNEGSEMSLQLKPEHLGKLTMKISIEKGIVIAEFLAESQAVKEILESNMNALKDALTEKGLGVQQLSVSVGDHSNFQDQQKFMTFKKKSNKGKAGFNEANYIHSPADVGMNRSQLLSTSNVDFLA